MVLATFDIMPPSSSGETDMKLVQGMIKYVYSHSSYWLWFTDVYVLLVILFVFNVV